MCARFASPCVGLCSTTLGDPVCRGCQRTDEEIGEWMALSVEQRDHRMTELDGLRERVAGRYLQVDDEACLETQLKRHRIRFRSEQPALSRVVELLRVGRDRIRDLRRYGLSPREGAVGLDAAELHHRLSAELLVEAGERRRAQQSHMDSPCCLPDPDPEYPS